MNAQKNDQVKQIEKKEILQKDHKKCWGCEKKVGIRGFKCKCRYTFCKKHRMPEDHECEFDFADYGKKKLKENNITVQTNKIEKIQFNYFNTSYF